MRPSDRRGPCETNATCRARCACHRAKEHYFTGFSPLNRDTGVRAPVGTQASAFSLGTSFSGRRGFPFKADGAGCRSRTGFPRQKPPFPARATCGAGPDPASSQINGRPPGARGGGLHISPGDLSHGFSPRRELCIHGPAGRVSLSPLP